jgi:pimeloyl-ACP methyl ester carboxylesterase
LYSYASVTARNARSDDASTWSFSVIEHLFDAIKEATGNASRDYFLYGHSEGGQFVHRLVLLLPQARYATAIAANPGWYTMPTFAVRYPYGLAGAPANEKSLAQSLGRQFVLMLGTRDTNPNDADLRKTPEALAQGRHRFERGQNFMAEARARAAELKTPIAWTVETVSGAAHDNSAMSVAAAAVFLRRD